MILTKFTFTAFIQFQIAVAVIKNEESDIEVFHTK